MAINYGKITSVVSNQLYNFTAPLIEKNGNSFMRMISDFLNKNHDSLYDIAPYDNILFSASDKAKIFLSLGITENQVAEILKDCFWYNKPINPQAAKEPYVELLICVFMYYYKHKKMKEAEITIIFLAFSGKFYASVYGAQFPKASPSKYRSVMDYVVNSSLNDKFDLKTEGSVFGAVKKICLTLINTYGSDIASGDADDDEVKYFIQQLRDRLHAFLKKIAKLYYDAWENRKYLNFESDNLSDGSEFRITDSDATIAARITENAVSYMINNNVSLKICDGFKDANIRPTELRDLIEAIVSDKTNINDIYRVCNILICDFIRHYPGAPIGGVDFLGHCLTEQPNTKDKYIIEMQNIIVSWLNEKSPNYRRRKSRKPTEISYRKSIKYYFTMVIAQIANN